MERKDLKKRSYNLSKALVKYFANWCKPGRDYSPKVAAGMLLYMAMDPKVREAAEKLAYKTKFEDFATSMSKIQSLLSDHYFDTKQKEAFGLNKKHISKK